MKNIRIIGCFVSLIMLMGCFKDEGTYEYKDLQAPTWLFDYKREPFRLITTAGDVLRGAVPFKFGKDSTEILANCRYEWWFKGSLLSEERELVIPADTLMSRLNLTFSEANGLIGSFFIVNEKTGAKHVVRTSVTISPQYTQGDWLLLSEQGADSKLSLFKKKSQTGANGLPVVSYKLHDNLFEEINKSKLLGSPRSLKYSQGRDISVLVGVTSVVTDKSAYILNNEKFRYVNEYKNEFLDGTPSNLKVGNIFHSRLVTYMASEDGKLYRRLMTDNWLGGKFLADPYVIDTKGYKITEFGQGRTAQNNSISPVYDELNRRVLMIKIKVPPYRILPVKLLPGTTNPTPVWEMPAGTELVYLGASNHTTFPFSGGLFTMIYNLNGVTRLADFVVNQDDAVVLTDPTLKVKDVVFPGGSLPKGTKFLKTTESNERKNYLFYTKGTELRMLNRLTETDELYMSFGSKITDLKYAAFGGNFNQMALGFENGDFLMINISDFNLPKIMPETKVNVGGKIADMLELRHDASEDAY